MQQLVDTFTAMVKAMFNNMPARTAESDSARVEEATQGAPEAPTLI